MTNELVPSQRPGTQKGHDLSVALNPWREFVWEANADWPQIVLRFPNNYGASIIPDVTSPSRLIELAVAHFEEDNSRVLDYDTPVTYDVLRLELHELEAILVDIKDLPPWTRARSLLEDGEEIA